MYVDLKDMLSDNVALKKRLDEVGTMNHLQLSSKYCEIQYPLSWVYCFLSFIAAKVDDPLSTNSLHTACPGPCHTSCGESLVVLMTAFSGSI